MHISYFTICSANYLAYARTLAQSLSVADSSVQLTVFLADEPVSLDFPERNLTVVPAERIGIEGYRNMAFRYSVLEMNTAIKPSCFLHVLNQPDCDAAVYLDPDIFVLKPLEHVRLALEAGASCILTPHVLAGIKDGEMPDEDFYLLCGAFNLGFAAFSNSAEARSFLNWWAGKCRRDCLVDLARGIFTDQSFCDLAPSFLDRFVALRHPGYNLAYWNVPQRSVRRVGQEYLVNEQPLYFAHFSGIVPTDPESFSKHQRRFKRSDLGELRPLVDSYAQSLIDNNRLGSISLSSLPYAFGSFRSGLPITDPHRWAFRRFEWKVEQETDPFDLGPDFFNQPAGDPGDYLSAISRLYLALWEGQAHLQAAFDLRTRQGLLGFSAWAARHLAEDYGIEPRFIAPPLDASEVGLMPKDQLLERALTSKSCMRRNRARTYLMGKSRSKDYWNRRLEAAPTRTPDELLRSSNALPDGIEIFGYFKTETGVGEAARGFLAAVRQTDIPRNCHVLSAGDTFENSVPFEFFGTNGQYNTALICANADVMAGPSPRVPRSWTPGRRRIGHWAWELSRFPDEWLSAFEQVDEVWGASRFVARTLSEATSKPVRVVPYVVRGQRIERRTARKELDLPLDRFIFVATFDLNSYIARKNPLAAISAFRAAFSGTMADPPLLILKFHGNGEAGRRLLREAAAADSRIMLIDEVFTSQKMNTLRCAANAFISLHRSEGFGLNIAEAMLAETLSIATAYSGNADFTHEGNSIPIPFKMRDVQADEYPFGLGQQWAEPDHDAAVEAMRWAFQNVDDAQRLAREGRRFVEDNYSPAAVSRTILGALSGRSEIRFALARGSEDGLSARLGAI